MEKWKRLLWSYIGFRVSVVYWDNGRGNGNYRDYSDSIEVYYRDYMNMGYIYGLYWDNGKENGNYYMFLTGS